MTSETHRLPLCPAALGSSGGILRGDEGIAFVP
jgi:hypothetical protein